MAVYFIRNPGSDHVKIGYSSRPSERLQALRTASATDLVIEVVLPGQGAEEAALHRRFAEQRLRGEWFVWSGPVAEFVAALPAPPRRYVEELEREAYHVPSRGGFASVAELIADPDQLIDASAHLRRGAEALLSEARRLDALWLAVTEAA